MKLTDYDLKQIDHDTLNRLSPEQVLSLSHQMIDDLKELRDRLNQNSNNSSRPSGSMPPWTSNDTQNPADQDNADDADPVIQDPTDETNLSEWRLVGPRLAAMIVLLSKRHRNSCRLIREFLLVFLRLELSVGTINQTIRETGRSVAPLEEELIQDLEEAALAYVDETSWKEAGVLRWLWVFRTLTVVFFMVGKRDRTIFCKLLLNGKFKGIVMSDGWVVYREYANRLRCWAHLIRKARGLSESYHTKTADIGLQMVIDRRLSHGTRTAEGTRSFTLLASVIETCRIRGAPTWDYLTSVIAAARKGLQLPALPIMQA